MTDSIDYKPGHLRPDELAFYKAIAANRHSDVPRLVYSDWLEEQPGRQNQAEFIRAQIERQHVRHQHKAKPPNAPRCPACAMDKEIRRLWGLLAPRDTKTNPVIYLILRTDNEEIARLPISIYYGENQYGADPHGRKGVFRRGFLDELQLTAAQLLSCMDYLYEHLPITKVLLTTLVRSRADGNHAWLVDDPKLTPKTSNIFPPQPSFHRDAVRRRMQNLGSNIRDNEDPFDEPDLEERLCELRWPGVRFEESIPILIEE